MRTVKILIIFFVLAMVFTGCSNADIIEVHYKDHTFKVEVARTLDEQLKGLMFRKSLRPDSGMLFIFEEEGPKAFHMKNTYIPLDIIWIGKDKRVVFIKKNARPTFGDFYERIAPTQNAMYVLELSAGTSDRIGLKVDDKLRF